MHSFSLYNKTETKLETVSWVFIPFLLHFTSSYYKATIIILMKSSFNTHSPICILFQMKFSFSSLVIKDASWKKSRSKTLLNANWVWIDGWMGVMGSWTLSTNTIYSDGYCYKRQKINGRKKKSEINGKSSGKTKAIIIYLNLLAFCLAVSVCVGVCVHICEI